MINEERLAEEMMELVRIDSETGFEQEIAKHLKERFESLGCVVEEDHAAEVTGHGAGNLICTWPGDGNHSDADMIYFTSHMDTVTPGMNVRPVLEDGVIKSDGTTVLGADDKAGLAVMLETIRSMQEENKPHGPVQFVITVGEESGLKGAKALDTSLLQAKMGYALDSDGSVGHIVTSAPFQSKLQIKVNGRKAHAGLAPEKGISAITAASRAVSKMPLGRIDEETTANIGRFEGGGPTNVVCDEVSILAEARSLSEEKLNAQVEKMKEAVQKAAESMGTTAEVEVTLMYSGYKLNVEDQVVALAFKAAEAIGLKPELLQSGGGSDANIISGYGIPTVNLAVGYEHIHTTDEKMPVAELKKLAELVGTIIEEAASLNR
ncbi:M20/M25/M40 family metallo-hydrolase [Salibacterium halotolerans]|uniref:Tripeptide aminopeptidase n=1 Tax=Salibacterium halotolerans TaxID=1884432 RepID=A0A1I5NRN7_9BACI|nr:M20/M25/M40 family metallo-hydrolase [Salibacterium halotolerans]SFP24337.1 tripeptide aminopeptidase [Salibacterium halotolerans]